jgi:hypothetical protein
MHSSELHQSSELSFRNREIKQPEGSPSAESSITQAIQQFVAMFSIVHENRTAHQLPNGGNQ